tara:strand:+ start:12010 stop:13131 length:1122 start_codon:yes stop_codon:yes gene_type:complete
MDSELNITDDNRIRAALLTINKIILLGGSVILMSHRGRPNGYSSDLSMRHLVKPLSNLLNLNVKFVDQCIGEKVVRISKSLKSGEVLLLENLRFHDEEIAGNTLFAKELSALGDIFVNDAFGTAHRAHASTSVIAQFFKKKKCFGYVMSNEIMSLNKVIKNPKKPFTAIIGGAKVSSKIDVILSLLNKVDNLIIGGGMTYTFIKALGGNVGSSLVEEDKLNIALDIIEKSKVSGVNLCLPIDSINADKFENSANKSYSLIGNISDDLIGLDIGHLTAKKFTRIIELSETVLWNGPMGVFEMENFSAGTRAIAEALVNATLNGAFTLVGGGDSVAAINKYKLSEKVSYISTGGGAMLEYLEGKRLPGITAISKD